MDQSEGAVASAEFHCCSIEVADKNLRYLVAVDLARCPLDPTMLNEASINITVTDGRHAWYGEGLTEQNLGSTIPNRMKHALEALVHLQPRSEEYSIRFSEIENNQLLVEVEWDNKRHGKDITSRVYFKLEALDDSAAAVRSIMGKILKASDGLRTMTTDLEESIKALQMRIQDRHEELELYACEREIQDADVALKAADFIRIAEDAAGGI